MIYITAVCMVQCYFVGYKQPEILNVEISFERKV